MLPLVWRYVKRTFVVLFTVLIVIVAAVVIYARSSAARRHLRSFLLRELNETYDIPTEIEDAELTLIPPAIRLHGLRISHESEGLFLEARSLTVTPEVWPLLRGRYRFEEIALEEPRIVLKLRRGELLNVPEPRKPPGDDSPTPVVDAFAIIDGIVEIEIEDVDGRPPVRIRVEGVNLDLTGDRNEVFEARALATGGGIRWGTLQRAIHRFEARLGVNPTELSVRKLILQLGPAGDPLVAARDADTEAPPVGPDDVYLDVARGHLGFGGEQEGRLSVTTRTPLSVLSELPEWLGLPDLGGHASAEGEIAFALHGGSAPTWRSDWTVALDAFRTPGIVVGDVAGRLELGADRIRARGLAVETGVGRLTVDGSLEVGDPTLPFGGVVRMEGLRFADLLERLNVPRSKVVQTFDGAVVVTGRGAPFTLTAMLDTDVTRFATFDDSFRFDQKGTVLAMPPTHVTGGVLVNDDLLAITPTRVSFGRSDLAVTGGYRFDDAFFLLDVHGRPLDPDDLRDLVGQPISGRGPIHVRIAGPIASPEITAEIDFRDFEFIDRTFGDVRATLHYQDRLLRFPRIHASIGESAYDVENLAFDFRDPTHGRWTATARIVPRPVRVQDLALVLTGDPTRLAEFDGWIEGNVDLTYRAWLRDFDVRFDARARRASLRGEPVDLVAASGRYRGGELRIPHARLERFGGWLEGSATMSPRGRITADVTGAGIPVHRILDGAIARTGLAGTASVQAHLEGTADALDGSGTIALGDASWQHHDLGTVGLGFLLTHGDRLHAWGGVETGGLRLNVLADLVPRLRVGVTATFASLQPLPFLDDPRTDPYDLRISGRTAFVVEERRPDRYAVEGKADLAECVLDTPEGTIRSIGPLWLSFSEHGAEILRAEIELPAASRVSVLGRVEQNRLDLDARGEADVATIAALIPDFPEVEGRIEFGARAAGTLRDPTFVGTARLTAGRMELGESVGTFDDVDAEVTLTPTQISVDRLSGRVLGGTVRARGVVDLRRLRPEAFAFDVDFGGMSFPITETLPASFDGTIAVAGDRAGGFLPMVTGDVYITRLQYTDPINLGMSLGRFGRGAPERIPTFRPQDDFVRFDVRLHGDSGIGVRNNALEAAVRIDEAGQPFRIVGTNQVFGVVGTAVIEHGRLNWRSSAFDVTRGVVTFDSPWRIDPRFDIVAETELRDWRITLTASGRKDDLTILTTSQPELSDEDIVLLLAIGMTREEAEMLGTGGTVGGALLAEVFGEAIGVSDRFDRYVPIVDQMRLTSEYSTRTGRTEPRITVGKRITDDVRIEATSSLTDTRDFRAVISYEVTDRLSVEGVYDNDTDSQFGNVGGDIRWRIEF